MLVKSRALSPFTESIGKYLGIVPRSPVFSCRNDEGLAFLTEPFEGGALSLIVVSSGEEENGSASNRNEAVSKIQGAMDEKAIAAHFKEKHPGQQVMSVGSVHALNRAGNIGGVELPSLRQVPH